VSVESELLAREAVVLRGWIGAAGAGLEPVLPLATAAGNAGGPSGPYVLSGTDDGGATLFALHFDDQSLAVIPGRGERYFVFEADLSGRDAAALAAVALDAGDGPQVLRRSTASRDALRAGLTGAQGVRLAALDGGRIAVTWDARRFAMLQVRDPASGAVLALDRDGEVTVTAPGGVLEIALSDGVRSAAALFRAAESP
jgi:hypothetical protein